MWRDLLRRLSARPHSDRRQLRQSAGDDAWETVGRTPPATSDILSRIEQTALEIYAAHGLPTRPGDYRRARRGRGWTFLGEGLTPETRWTLMLERPPEAGWVYGALRDLGRTGAPELQAASALLVGCAELREGLAGRGARDALADMERAIQLGRDWRALEEGRRFKGNSPPLQLMTPDDVGPASPKRRKARRPASQARP